MEKERINLFVTKEQAEMIGNSVEGRKDLWKKTLDYHSGNENVVGDIEECSHEAEAEYVFSRYDELNKYLGSKMIEVGANEIDYLTVGQLELSNQTIEVIKLTRNQWGWVVYVFNDRGDSYYFFDSMWEMIQYFDVGKEPDHIFGSEVELDAFLRHWTG